MNEKKIYRERIRSGVWCWVDLVQKSISKVVDNPCFYIELFFRRV